LGERREGVEEWYPPVNSHILYNSQCVLANKTCMLNEIIELKIHPVPIFLYKFVAPLQNRNKIPAKPIKICL
jgi:hypothetical protein